MRARTLIGFVVLASFIACGGPEETFKAKGGLTGAAGTTGTAGTSVNPAGVAGTTGSAGTFVDPTGVAGTTGTAGTTAAAGTTGTAGTTAAAGTTGTAGTKGAAGTTGTAGTTGVAGTTGMAGTMGAAGTTGTAGTMGAAGTAPPLPITRIDSAGAAAAPWLADVNFTGGSVGQTNNGAVDRAGVTNAAPETVYQTTRIGTFSYTIPGYTANTMHTVRLHFCETYFPPPGDTTGGANRRLCTISINGKAVLTNYDIFAKAGAKMKAVVEQFTEPANGTGQYVLQFTTTKDNCALGGIEIQ